MKLVAFQQLTAALVSDAVLDAAFPWLCRQGRDSPANADVWSFRRDWTPNRILPPVHWENRCQCRILQCQTSIPLGEGAYGAKQQKPTANNTFPNETALRNRIARREPHCSKGVANDRHRPFTSLTLYIFDEISCMMISNWGHIKGDWKISK